MGTTLIQLAPPNLTPGALKDQDGWLGPSVAAPYSVLIAAAGVLPVNFSGASSTDGNASDHHPVDPITDTGSLTLACSYIHRTAGSHDELNLILQNGSSGTPIAFVRLKYTLDPDVMNVTISDDGGGGGTTSFAQTPSTSQWHDVLLVVNGGTNQLRLSVDGTLVLTYTPVSPAPWAWADDFYMSFYNATDGVQQWRGSSLALTSYAGNAASGTITTTTGTITAANSTPGTFTLDAAYTGTLTFTDNKTGSTFNPTSYTNASQGTFTITPAVGGTHTLSGTGSPALTITSGSLIVWGPLHVSVVRSGADAIVSFDYVGADTFAVSVDGGAYTVQTSPYTATGKGTGSHTFTVRAFGGPVTNLLASEPFTYADNTIVSGINSGADWLVEAMDFDGINGPSVPNAIWVEGNTAVCNAAALTTQIRVAAFRKTPVRIGASYSLQADVYLNGSSAIDAELHIRNPLTEAATFTFLSFGKSVASFQNQDGTIGTAATGLGLADGFHTVKIDVVGDTLAASIDGVLKKTVTSSTNNTDGGVGFKFRNARTTSAQGVKNFLLYDNYLAQGSASLRASSSGGCANSIVLGMV